MLPLYHASTLPRIHSTTLPFYHSIIEPLYHFIPLSLHRYITFSLHHYHSTTLFKLPWLPGNLFIKVKANLVETHGPLLPRRLQIVEDLSRQLRRNGRHVDWKIRRVRFWIGSGENDLLRVVGLGHDRRG